MTTRFQRTAILTILMLSGTVKSQAQDGYALDDAHNHDGTHVEGQSDCGNNYLLPDSIARLGSHSFLILGQDGPNHLLLDHRSGTPPHNYQFILRVRVDSAEMGIYKKLLQESKKSLPAVTTIDYDKSGKQVGRTFFCLHELPKIFGTEQRTDDPFSILFPIRASWQKDADFEGAFPIEETVVPEDPLIIERKDVEIVLYRYLPAYLDQSVFRKMLKDTGSRATQRLTDAPLFYNDTIEAASKRTSYVQSNAMISVAGESCPADYYLKTFAPPKTIHTFLLLSEDTVDQVLAVHYYDQAPQNYQTVLKLKLNNQEMKLFKEAKRKSKTPIVFQTRRRNSAEVSEFCMSDIKKLAKSDGFKMNGTLFIDTDLRSFKLGKPLGELQIEAKEVNVLVNRPLQSLMNAQAVAREVFGFVNLSQINKEIRVEMRYATDWNFVGRKVTGYFGNTCFLTEKAAKALSGVQGDASKLGYSLLVFDCYRPQRAVDEFVVWTKAQADNKMKAVYYPDEPKEELIARGYIDSRSGHSRGSVVDLTLVKADSLQSSVPGKLRYKESTKDCRDTQKVEKTGQLDMGTAYDCFSTLSHTANPKVSESSRKNRMLLKSLMEKHGFSNYSKEWWHFALKEEPYKDQFFDFEVR